MKHLETVGVLVLFLIAITILVLNNQQQAKGFGAVAQEVNALKMMLESHAKSGPNTPQFSVMHGFYFAQDPKEAGFRMIKVDKDGTILLRNENHSEKK